MTDVPWHERISCRLCSSRKLSDVLTLTPTPPANAFAASQETARKLESYPLTVRRCAQCGHAQLAHVLDPRALFSNYVYVSGTSPAFVTHFESYAESAISTIGLTDGDLVIDIGSNDGTLLKCFQQHGQRVKGIDPARDIANAATADGVPTINDFFSESLAQDIRTADGHARLVVANNVCAHIDDLAAVVRAVETLLGPDGEFWLEVSYLLSVMEGTLFDTIYHEHLDYHRVEPLVAFFAKFGLKVWDVERTSPHGGSLRVKVARQGVRTVTHAVADLIAQEHAAGLADEHAWTQFGAAIETAGVSLREQLAQYADQGFRGAGYGATAKATTLMYQYGLDASCLDYIVDDSPLKQGLYSPGFGIPIVTSEHARSKPPDFMLVLAWNFAGPILRNNRWLADTGGRFVVPLPTLETH